MAQDGNDWEDGERYCTIREEGLSDPPRGRGNIVINLQG